MPKKEHWIPPKGGPWYGSPEEAGLLRLLARRFDQQASADHDSRLSGPCPGDVSGRDRFSAFMGGRFGIASRDKTHIYAAFTTILPCGCKVVRKYRIPKRRVDRPLTRVK